jgi:hypothetical protein
MVCIVFTFNHRESTSTHYITAAHSLPDFGKQKNRHLRAMLGHATKPCGMRGITPETACLLAQVFGTRLEFWVNLQMAYDLARSRPKQRITSLVAVT